MNLAGVEAVLNAASERSSLSLCALDLRESFAHSRYLR